MKKRLIQEHAECDRSTQDQHKPFHIDTYGAFTIKKANNHNKLLHNHHTSHFIGYNAQQDGGHIGSTDSAILNSVYSRSL